MKVIWTKSKITATFFRETFPYPVPKCEETHTTLMEGYSSSFNEIIRQPQFNFCDSLI